MVQRASDFAEITLSGWLKEGELVSQTNHGWKWWWKRHLLPSSLFLVSCHTKNEREGIIFHPFNWFSFSASCFLFCKRSNATISHIPFRMDGRSERHDGSNMNLPPVASLVLVVIFDCREDFLPSTSKIWAWMSLVFTHREEDKVMMVHSHGCSLPASSAKIYHWYAEGIGCGNCQRKGHRYWDGCLFLWLTVWPSPDCLCISHRENCVGEKVRRNLLHHHHHFTTSSSQALHLSLRGENEKATYLLLFLEAFIKMAEFWLLLFPCSLMSYMNTEERGRREEWKEYVFFHYDSIQPSPTINSLCLSRQVIPSFKREKGDTKGWEWMKRRGEANIQQDAQE